MPARFVPPTPNCGHVDGVTFTFNVLAAIWMCSLCSSSIRGLAPTCSRCGAMAIPGTQLVDTLKHGRLCTTCQRTVRALHRPT